MRFSPHLVAFAFVSFAALSVGAQNAPSFAPISLLPIDAPVDGYAVTGDGNRVYYTNAKGEVMLYDRKTQKTTRISEGGNIWDITVSRNGSAVAYTKLGESTKDEFNWVIPLDPATGFATGPQRRASMIPGDTPALSQDGRFLAFARDDSASQSLVVLPTLGGPERIFGSFRGGIGTIQWAPDGKTVFFSINPGRQNPNAESNIQRVSVDGGAPKVVVSTMMGWPGLSPDGSLIAFGDSSSTRAIVIADVNGRRLGTFAAPVGFRISRWLNGTTLLASRIEHPSRMHIYSLADGTSRVLVDSIDGTQWPMFSPRGDQVSFATSADGWRNLVITKRDGSSARAIPLERPYGHNLSWSPDGRWIVYSTNGLPTTAVAVEVATGKQIPLGTSPADIFVRWADETHVLLRIALENGAARTVSIREYDLTGGFKELFQIPTAAGYQIFPIDRRSALVSRGADKPRMIESLTGGPSVQLLSALPGSSGGVTFSASGDWVAVRRNPQSSDYTRFTILDFAKLDGSVQTSIDLPFSTAPGAAGFLPGDKQMIVSESPATSKKPSVYLVTIATREIKKLFTYSSSNDRYAQVAPSPDGKSIVYVNRDSLPAGYATLDVARFLRAKP